MATTGVIIKDKPKFFVDNFIDDVKHACANANLNIFVSNTTYNDDGSISDSSMNIIDNQLVNGKKQEFIINVTNFDKENDFNDFFNWVDNSKELLRIAFIDPVSDNEELLFKFMYELFTVNPDGYLWIDGCEWVYTFEILKKLKQLPFDPEWCYKNPNLI